MSEPAALTKARLIALDAEGNDTSTVVLLDFNPETLSVRVQPSLATAEGQAPRQNAVQTTSTLSFEALFDTTRPATLVDGATQPELLDVRNKTKALVALFETTNSDGHPRPSNLRFQWGSVSFTGVFDSYSETLEYFSPAGVPLRSRVSVALTEQRFQYATDESARSVPRGGGAGGGIGGGLSFDGQLGLNASLSASVGLSASLDVSAGIGLSADIDVSAGLSVSADVDVDVSVGISASVDLSATAAVDFDLSADVAVEVFGGAVVAGAVGAGVDLGQSRVTNPRGRPGSSGLAVGQPTPTPTTWAPGGPTVGSRAAGVASVVAQDRADGRHRLTATPPAAALPQRGSGVATSIAQPVQATAPVPPPIRGSPPRVMPRLGEPVAGSVFPTAAAVAMSSLRRAGRPRWEGLDPGVPEAELPPSTRCCPPPGRRPHAS